MKLLNNLKLLLGGIAVASLAACGGGGGGSTAGSGTLRLALTDAPACGYDAVNVTIQKVRIHQSSSASGSEGEGGWSEIVLNPARRVNLLKLQNGDLAELGEVALPTGSYNQMRLVLDDGKGKDALANSVIPVGGTEVQLEAPSGSQSGVKAKQFKIDIGPNQLANFVIDFDACKSVVAAAPGKYLLKPQLTVIPRYISGVKGSVDPTLLAGYTNVSLQKDGVVVKATAPDKDSNFLLPAAPGSYTLVMTALGRTTSVVTGVTVVEKTVTSVTPLIPTVSDTGFLTGTAPVDTLVRVLQPLTLTSGNPASVEVAGQFVNGITGTYIYRYELPVAAPRVAPYVSASVPLVFTPDTAEVAGKYTVKASLTGFAEKTAVLAPLTTTTPIETNFTFP